MKNFILFIISILFFVQISRVSGNDVTSHEPKIIYGQVISANDQMPVPNVHIINLHNARGTSSREDGSFAMLVSTGNMLTVQAIGYETDTLLISREFILAGDSLIVVLREKIYELPVVNIYPYATFADFKYAFLNFKDPDPVIDLNLPMNIPELAPPTGVIIQGPITALYDQFSRRGREMQKYQQVTVAAEMSRRASKVVNIELVQRITGIQDEKEVYDFLDFCNLTDEFIVSRREFEVYEALLACFRTYQGLKN